MPIQVVEDTLVYLESELVVDTTGTPVTTKINTDWTKSCKKRGSATTVTLTITHDANGVYDITGTFAETGTYFASYSVVVDGITQRFTQTVQVITAAQIDPVSALSGYTVTTVSPIAQSGLVTIKRGDDYYAADGIARTIEWVQDADIVWPDLTGATITFGAKNQLGNETITATGSVIIATGDDKTVRVELAGSDTATKTPGTWRFDVQATPASGRDQTLVTGTMVLEQDYAP